MESRTTRNDDGTFDIVQRGCATWQPSAEYLQDIYWRELRRATFGLTHFSRDAVRIFGFWPALLRFGPMRDGGRPIVGGIFARRPHGVIRWSADGGEVVVAVQSFAPLLRGPLWWFESWFHAIVGRRFVTAAARPEA